jgi:recombination protein RecA
MEKTMSNDDKKKKKTDDSPEKRLEQFKRVLGIKDNSVRLADQYVAIKDVISTGMPELDRIITPMIFEKTGKGGIPRGFVSEFFGPHAGGKSSLCMKLSASVTKAGGHVLWVDAEGSYIPEWAERHGVDNGRVQYIENDGKIGEHFLDMVEKGAKSGLFHLIVIDSVTALIPREILEADVDKDARLGAAARMLTRWVPKIMSAAKQGNTAVIFINQIRQKIGVMYGSPETRPGGEALGFYCSLRLRLSQVGNKKERQIMKGEEGIGTRTNVKIDKSRFGKPGEAIMPIYYSDTPPHPLDVLLDAALSSKIIRSRSKTTETNEIVLTFSFNDLKIEGIDDFKLQLTPEHIKDLAKKVIEERINLSQEVVDYVKSLDAEDPTASANTDSADDAEGDPGA